MYNVRYYDKVIHPDYFKGHGLLGVVIVLLNWCRWRLEVLVQRLVLRHLAKEGGLPKERMSALRKVFDLDVQAEALQKEQTSPLVQPLSEEDELMRSLAARSDRYHGGRQTTALGVAAESEGGGLPVRPKSILDLASRYSAGPRQRRYASGQKFHMGDPEGDFEPVIVPDTPK